MAEFDLKPDMPHALDDGRRRLLAADPFPAFPPPTLDAPSADPRVTMPWTPDDEIRREMARLEAGYAIAGESPDGPYPTDPLPGGVPPAYAHTPLPGAFNADSYARAQDFTPGGSDDVSRLQAENEEMHKLIEEMKHIFEQATSQEEANVRALEETRGRLVDLERQVQEKDDQVALLTGQIGELEKHIQESPAAPPPPPSEDELAKLADELEKERCSLAQDRRAIDQEKNQLKEDEDALMKQMREMEVQMAKERAELARQRTDLQRLHAEVKHELDQLQRGDGALKDRLAQFQRRHQSVFDRNAAPAESPPAAAAPAPAAPAASNGRTDSGLMRRFFGRT
jgi:hypothetical protein